MTNSSSQRVLDHGYVRVRDVMGTDLTVVNSARVSFDKESQAIGSGDVRLLKYLATNGHWSPFAHPTVQFEINAPIMVLRQWKKHRVGGVYSEELEDHDEAWNEESKRYVTSENEFYIPSEWRGAPANKKQGSEGLLDPLNSIYATNDLRDYIEKGERLYQGWLDKGMAPEQARLFLPYAGMYTRLMWRPSLYRIFTFLRERLNPHAQWEIELYAAAIRDLVRPLFPLSFEAFGLGEETDVDAGR